MQFDLVGPEAIAEGRATDAYFLRTEETLDGADHSPEVVCEVTADQFPTGQFEVFAGINDVMALLEGLPITVHALAEGTMFDGGPVMRIEGAYRAFCRYETALLGFLSGASAQATAAREVVEAADGRRVLSFGARHVHPAATAALERAALVGGVDGISHVAAGEQIGYEAGGTMPHALVLCFGPGEQELAWQAFDEAVDPSVPRIALADTFDDEVEEAVRAAEAIDLDGVRLDTTASRRGDMRHIAREVRWELDSQGHEDVEIFLSGGVGPAAIAETRDVVEGFGVGSYISNAAPVDFSMDIVELSGEPLSKRGKLSGVKQVYRTAEGEHLVSRAGVAVDGEALLEPIIENGEITREPDLDGARRRCATETGRVGFPSA